ncbi:FAST kinase domain-containing protein 4 isoform X1 [Megachile rotundata]|uniref:FAST kinase domain-containing protein 4 isoform X1 n=2 Tax=Megachile rotundata TaxID=143995 RepID=UPI003FD53439
MLQFNTIVCTASAKFTSRLWWKLSMPLTTNAAAVSDTANKLQQVRKNIKKETLKPHTNFDLLKKEVCNFLHMKSIDTVNVTKATNIEEIMEMTETSLLSPEDNATIKKIIDTWVANNNKVQQIVNKSEKPTNEQSIDTSDMVFDLDHKYGSVSTSGLIREVSMLTQNNNRNVPVIRYIFNNILKYNNMLSPGQCASLMYCMGKLNFSDERLLNKICIDLEHKFSNSKSYSSKLISIVNSMAHIRYKNKNFLERMCDVIIRPDYAISYAQLIKLLLSLAILGHESKGVDNIIEKFLPAITTLGNTFDYLNLVWSLTVLNKANNECISRLFDDDFITKLTSAKNCFDTHILKLLNIDAYAKYILKDYSGPLLNGTVEPITKKYTTQKKLYLEMLEDTLKNVLPSPSYFRMNINTNMGFLLGAELYLDSNSRPVCVNAVKDDCRKIGIMMYDFYELSLGSLEPLGLVNLYTRLLQACQYEVINISYNHFGVEDKPEKRAMYLRSRLWNKYNNDSFYKNAVK